MNVVWKVLIINTSGFLWLGLRVELGLVTRRVGFVAAVRRLSAAAAASAVGLLLLLLSAADDRLSTINISATIATSTITNYMQ